MANNRLNPLLSYFEECYDGNLLSFAQWLDKAIYMFHYLPTDTFTDLERQNISHIFMEFKRVIMEIHSDNNQYYRS